MSAAPLPRLEHPIVLVHGLCGFRALAVAGRVMAEYFRGIPGQLAASGNRVYAARVSPTGGVEQRAADLREFLLRELPNEPVHLIGHSMGGLDARYLVSRRQPQSANAVPRCGVPTVVTDRTRDSIPRRDTR